MAWLEKRNRRYFIAWREGSKVRRWGGDVSGWSDKVVAKAELGAFIKKQLRGEEYADPFRDHRNRPLSEHIADYVADLEAKGRDDIYVYNCEKLLNRLFSECGWRLLGDITADSFCHWRESLPLYEDGDLKGLPKIGARSQNQYLCAVRTFCKWAVKRVRMGSNPLLSIDTVDESADIRRARRALSAEEVDALLNAKGMTDSHKLVYRVVLATGLRRQELKDLIWDDLHLDSITPYVALRAKATKARRNDTLPLHPEIATSLKASRGDCGEADRVFHDVPSIAEHRAYLDAAEIAWTDELGRRADFHALRGTFGTMLATSGASPNETKELMRHTEMRLTQKHYIDPKVFNLAGAVGRLKIPGRDAGQTPKTGTGN